ncbi:phage holin family protein [Tissierella pigra]|uniref:Phage holin family protein n=1 Tax=Tissierella pigra TaxID=2607614 RepID=A0A6N7XF20_9FIRM|nr:phage holin family protein [Tissierella pigra]MBU5427968.1 phage holin family protein [Tissierella pigra]MSU00579.1 phage holin family protein [Tissierella pigra]
MDDKNRNPERDREREDNFNVGEMIIRVLVTAIVVGIAAYFTPGFTIDGIWSLILASIVIGVLDHLIQKFTGVSASPFGRGLSGFLVAALILYVTKFIIPGFHISVWGAIIGALVIGIVDAIIPGRAM